MKLVRCAVLGMLCMLATTAAYAQVQTGSIAGVATDSSNAVMPGVTVSVSGDKLIGGVHFWQVAGILVAGFEAAIFYRLVRRVAGRNEALLASMVLPATVLTLPNKIEPLSNAM